MMDGNGEELSLIKTKMGYDLYFRSNLIDQGTYKTSYVLIGHITGKTTACEHFNALVLS